MAKRKNHIFISFFFIILPILIGLVLVVEEIFMLKSNLYYLAFKKTSEEMKIKETEKKVSIFSATNKDIISSQKVIYQEQNFSLKKLNFNRKAISYPQKIISKLTKPSVFIIEFKGNNFKYDVLFLEKRKTTTAKNILKKFGCNFAINASFFSPQGKPLGRIIVNKEEINPKMPSWSGYFFVANNVPYFGPKSLFYEHQENIEKAIQVYPAIMKNHHIFPYVKMKDNRFFQGEKITYRSLGGMKQDGSIVFILSNQAGILNVRELAQLAQKLNLQHATLLDGGRALQYSLKINNFSMNFHAFNNKISLKNKILNRVLSPVFIGITKI